MSPVRFTVEMVPPYLNEYLRSHWAVKKGLRRAWAQAAGYSYLLASDGEFPRKGQDGRPGRMSVRIRILWPARTTDPDSLPAAAKPILDGMRDALLIRNDSGRWLDLDVTQGVDRERPRTEFEVSEAER